MRRRNGDADHAVKGDAREVAVLYGTSLGTCGDLAQQLADRAGAGGFPVTNATLDEWAGDLPAKGTLIVVTSTYNGGAPDTATKMDSDEPENRVGALDRPNCRLRCSATAIPSGRRIRRSPSGWGAALRRPEPRTCCARRDRWQRRLRRGRPGLAGRAVGGVGGADAAPRRRPIEVASARTRRGPQACPEQAYPLEVVSDDELVGTRPGCGTSARRRRAPPPGT